MEKTAPPPSQSSGAQSLTAAAMESGAEIGRTDLPPRAPKITLDARYEEDQG